MKKKSLFFFLIFGIMLCCSCSRQIYVTESARFARFQYRYVNRRSNRVINIMHTKADTVFNFSAGVANLLWYVKDDTMYSFDVFAHWRHMLRRYKPGIKENINIAAIRTEELDYYFDSSFFKDVPCFWDMLDGFSIGVHIKNQPSRHSSIDMRCLFSEQHDEASFPYKLQYMLSLLFRDSKSDFDKLYSPDLDEADSNEFPTEED